MTTMYKYKVFITCQIIEKISVILSQTIRKKKYFKNQFTKEQGLFTQPWSAKKLI